MFPREFQSLTTKPATLTLARMGSRSRYPGSFGPRISWGGMLTPGIRNIIIACTGVLFVQYVLRAFLPVSYTVDFNHFFGLVPYYVTRRFFLWQLATYLFLHDGIWHLFFNMLFLYFFGMDLERTWGTRRFYEYYFLTGIGAGAITVLINVLRDPHGTGALSGIPTIGASGAIFGVLIAAGIMFPDRQVWLIPFPIMIPMKLLVVGSIAIEFFLSLEVSGDTVSHVTHLGGALVGYLYLRRGLFLYRFRNDYLDWKRRRARRKFEVYMRDHKDEPPRGSDDRWVN
jgi:membrane associated rhomboid family serine protease